MIPRMRTIAILMLLAGLALGVFASRALRAMGGRDLTVRDVQGASPRVEQLVRLYQREYQLDDRRADRVRRELLRYDQQVGALIWELRQEHADRFQALYTDASGRIEALLERTGADGKEGR